MATPYLGQIMPAAFAFAPRDFARCDGALLPVNQNQALFSLLATIYGGNGVATFGLPDLRGRTPIGFGSAPDGTVYNIGAAGGAEGVALTSGQIPAHTHWANCSNNPVGARSPANGMFGNTGTTPLYAVSGGAQVQLNAATVSNTGSNAPHPNMQPFSVLNFCVALSGIFPTRT